MHCVLIVDDELMIRNGIAKIIPWKEMGVNEVLTAASGAEALKLMEEHRVDILLTDINMTEMNGLQLIETAKQKLPDLRVIVLTGYDSFEYAHQCCKLHVHDFLLKPADEKELEKVIQRQIDFLNEARQQEEQKKHFNRVQGVLEQLKLEQTLRDFVCHNISLAQTKVILDEYHYEVNQCLQAVVVVPKLQLQTEWKENKELLSLSVKHLLINLVDFRNEGITFEGPEGNIIIALFCGEEFEEAPIRLEKLRRIIYDEYDLNVKISLGSEVDSFGDFPYSYGEAISLLHNHNQESLNDILQPQNTEHRMRIFHEIFEELKKTMLANTGDFERLLRAFRAFEDCTESYNLSKLFVRRCCFEIASTLYYEYVSENGESVDNKLNALLSSLINSKKEDACKFTRSFISQLFGEKDTEKHEIIEQAKQYILHHLSEDLSVANIAESLYVTPNYFSRLFKKVCGEGCNEYIVRKRIHLAKGLLETTNQKTGKVAMLVGYRDTNYFSLAFKKHTGMSPTEYRENVRRGV